MCTTGCGLTVYQSTPIAVDSATDECGVVSAARDGNCHAFARLYEQYLPMVHGILLARVPRSEVDDLAQETFLQAWRKLGSLRNAGAFGSWLAMITRRQASDYRREAVETAELDENLRPSSPRLNEAISILEALRRLPQAYRETLILRLVEGMTGPEIARVVGMKPESVRVNLHRGMKLLRRELSAEVRA